MRDAATSEASSRIVRWRSATEARTPPACCSSCSTRSLATSIGGRAPAREVAPATIVNDSIAAAMRWPMPFGVTVPFSPTFPHRPAPHDA